MQFAIHADRDQWMGPALDSPEAVQPRKGRAQLPPELFAEDEEKTDPWARGACHFDLTREEWRKVRRAPLLSFLWVAAVDDRVHPGERLALVRVLEEGLHARSEVFREVCAELLLERGTLMAELVSEEPPREEQLPEVYRLLERKLGRNEAERFKWCLLEVGRQVAAASGGFFASWGWLRREERQALAGLALALDAGRARAEDAARVVSGDFGS
jgi:hypothetical protein